ncbi:Gfo/Idh/MocA family protein [Thalassoglobus polymorphus]|uniref:Glucose--fructose oxidoreductase n=1 Tax=Thalassoglobus polymorphus TaxID=2527994 RepID=A0A517QQ38_9PLAN|nr:Gfo/Idh/MocA family oxidoreductase [Thalassoglobus polymorphus]QDT33746.1 Glucose--fructose oxidoreductase precursor [Thalassoglobus polymorphus]
MPNKTTRRDFLQTSAAIGAAVYVGSPKAYAQGEERSANEVVSYACIGVGGKGSSDSADASKHGNIVAICDVDDRTLAKTGNRPGFKEAERFNDFREMLDKMGSKIDAVTVSTPDHTHAPAAAMAMKMGKACFCQKPLTHSVWEARRLVEIADDKGVKTMMGNQGTARDGLRHAAELLKAGKIGRIKEAHIFTNRPVWPQGGPRPEATTPPPNLHWNLWLGAAPERPYGEGAYHDFAWRGWWDFGTGALGDMACHTFNMPFAGLNLANPKSIQASCTGHNQDSYPKSSKIEFEFTHPSGEGTMPVHWYDGGNTPDESLLKGVKFKHKSGAIIVGEDRTLYSYQDYGDKWVLIENDGTEIAQKDAPQMEFEKSPGHFTEFHESIIGKRENAMSNFAKYAGPLTETILLGNLAVWAAASGESKKIEWDAENLKATNAPEVMNVVKKEYRENYGSYLDA